MIRALSLPGFGGQPSLKTYKKAKWICAALPCKPSRPPGPCSVIDLHISSALRSSSSIAIANVNANRAISFNVEGRRTYTASTTSGTRQRVANRLIDEKSPYLLQHAHNPVHW